eukprot:m.33253 g.33253  ORF g.33253 m.33253 type:complete len:1110 (+) comp4999_c0_seq1:77-3406(+)
MVKIWGPKGMNRAGGWRDRMDTSNRVVLLALLACAGPATTQTSPPYGFTTQPAPTAFVTTPTQSSPPTDSTVPTVTTTSTVQPAQLSSNNSGVSPWYMKAPMLGGAAVVVVLAVIACVVLRQRRRRLRRRRREQDEADKDQWDNGHAIPPSNQLGAVASSLPQHRSTPDVDIELGVLTHGRALPPWVEVGRLHGRRPQGPYKVPSRDVEELDTELKASYIVDIPLSQVQQLQTIEMGKAPYLVRKAILTTGRGTQVEATVKSLEGPGTGMVTDKLRELLREVAAMSQFDHVNVVRLLGVVWKGSGAPSHHPVVLYEHMPLGPLDRYLRRKKPSLHRRLSMCREIAQGVSYLTSVGYILGILSAKVVMVDKNEVCKLGDFFIHRDISDPSVPLPRAALSWFAPELYRQCDANVNPLWRKSGDSGLAGHSLASTDEDPRQVSHPADVWALGMVLWETWCNAQVAPYHRYPTSKIVGLVRRGQRPAAPPGCPRDVYAIMIDCWHPDPTRRTTAEAAMRALPQELDREATVLASVDDVVFYEDLQNRYLETTRASSGPLQGGGARDGQAVDAARSPSPLIHMSLVGLKNDANDTNKEKVAGFSTLSSRPSNYTSESGSNLSLHSRSAQGSPRDRDKNTPAFLKLFDQAPDDSGPLPPTLIRPRSMGDAAVDGYLQIDSDGPLSGVGSTPSLVEHVHLKRSESQRPRSYEPSRSLSETSSSAQQTHVAEPRRSTALSLALQGISPNGSDKAESRTASGNSRPSASASVSETSSRRGSTQSITMDDPIYALASAATHLYHHQAVSTTPMDMATDTGTTTSLPMSPHHHNHNHNAPHAIHMMGSRSAAALPPVRASGAGGRRGLATTSNNRAWQGSEDDNEKVLQHSNNGSHAMTAHTPSASVSFAKAVRGPGPVSMDPSTTATRDNEDEESGGKKRKKKVVTTTTLSSQSANASASASASGALGDPGLPAALPVVSKATADSAGGRGRGGGGWFKRTRRSTSSLTPSDVLSGSSSPEPGSLPSDPFGGEGGRSSGGHKHAAMLPSKGSNAAPRGGRHKGRRSPVDRDEDEVASLSMRDSPSPGAMPPQSRGFVLTASALNRIGKQRTGPTEADNT